jgi:hypothetical protein
LGFDQAHTLQTGPFALRVEKGDKFRIRNGPMPPDFKPTVVFIHRLMKIVSDILWFSAKSLDFLSV